MREEELKRMGMDCIRVITKKVSREISPEEYYSEIMQLHQRYPLPGHDPEFSPFQVKHYKKISVALVHPTNPKLTYSDYLRPMNFREAAEMYIRSRVDIGMVRDYKQLAYEPEETAPF